ncbi:MULTISPECIES: hypothetical protein [unclassified Bradyrhizobium]|uniref:hypothetical protein n=1 Tax=unclassified Bradyrhizobium TaxID=2631580 RepID=UPI001FF7975B|nr:MULTISPECIES: hypothetical protein [unclassified Bradyrhizobium]MCK1269293.1 hypothetical protein [Bradyrhizobium sp. 84]MCK1374999.1 hypothetical protein [Bradyrhizobium sp. 49]MCK1417875.1 hypothetical protein [Bradyrhizobium sp. CW4]MCK1426360.1 hypothetical protein [Bradyrhizobium sp. 87]
MTDPSDTAAGAPNMHAIKAGFVRLLSGRIRDISSDPRQIREIVYELARIKLLEQLTHGDARESRELQQVLERAIREVELSFDRSERDALSKAPELALDVASHQSPPSPPAPQPVPHLAPVPPSPPVPKPAETGRGSVAPPSPPDQSRRSGILNSLIRLAAILVVIAGASAAVTYWPRLRTQSLALWQSATLSKRTSTSPEPHSTGAVTPSSGESVERTPDQPKEPVTPAQPSMPLPTTFGVYALSQGQLQELKPVPGKIPDRRVAISAAITTPSATTLTSGDVSFIVFRPDGGVDATGTEVRVVAKVSRAMGVDATGKAAMVSAGDTWVIRSMSFPYKVGPVEDQPRMLSLQPEQDGFTLSPGRYVVVVKGMGYDFTVAGTPTDPNQCVERINATNGAFYSPCPPRR